MTTPHLASDDTAIHAAQDRIRGNLEARARACFDAALKRPSLGAVDAVRRALVALHHQWVAGLEQEPRPVVTELEGGMDVAAVAMSIAEAKLEPLRDAVRAAQSDFGRNPAPLTTNAGQERRPVPCVPRYPTGESA